MKRKGAGEGFCIFFTAWHPNVNLLSHFYLKISHNCKKREIHWLTTWFYTMKIVYFEAVKKKKSFYKKTQFQAFYFKISHSIQSFAVYFLYLLTIYELKLFLHQFFIFSLAVLEIWHCKIYIDNLNNSLPTVFFSPQFIFSQCANNKQNLSVRMRHWRAVQLFVGLQQLLQQAHIKGFFVSFLTAKTLLPVCCFNSLKWIQSSRGNRTYSCFGCSCFFLKDRR